jgi:hypothetical protein
MGLKITNKVGTSTRIKIPAKYITDDAINSQKQLDSVDVSARKVGLKINRAKIEFMMVGNWASSMELRVSTVTINLVLQVFRILAAKLHERF